jgi:hypothetical protein
MEENYPQSLNSRHSDDQPRKYIYRSVEPETECAHPLRRCSDTPREFHGVAGQICPRPLVLKMRVYLKLN